MPKDLLNRPKRGFSVPLDRWFQNDLKEYAEEIILDRSTLSRGLFDKSAIEQLLKDHQAGVRNCGREIWMLLVTELWHRMYIDRFD